MSTRKIPSRLWTAFALIAALALRLWFILHEPRITGDTLVYGGLARNWMLRGVYGWVENAGVVQPTLIRLPGYPLFLMGCFRLFGVGNYTAVLYIQAVIDLLACLLLAALAGRLFGSRARMAALWLAVLCPFTASYVAAPLTEILTLASITLTFYALHRWRIAGAAFNRWLWTIAAALGYSILLRPEQGLLAAAVIPAMLWIASRQTWVPYLGDSLIVAKVGDVRADTDVWVPHPFAASPREGGFHRLLPVFAAALCTLLPLVPWAIRNHRTFHVFQPLAPRFATDPGEFIPLGFQHWYRTWAIDYASTEDVYWNYDGGPIQIVDLPTRAFDTPTQRTTTQALLADYNKTTTATPELDAGFNALAAERTAAHPFRIRVALPAARLINMALRPRLELFRTALDWWAYREHPSDTLFAIAYGTLNLAYFVMATWGLTLWFKHGLPHAPLLTAALATIALRAALLLTLDNSEPRYTLEFFPVLILFAASCFSVCHSRRESASQATAI